jgi:hypothetical protein
VEIQDLAVVQARVVMEKELPAKDKDGQARQESASADKKDRKKTEKGKPDQNSGDNGREKPASGENKENAAAAAQPAPVFAEKKIPLLHRVQLFFYFDLRQAKTSGQSALVINLPRERERRFNFNFDSIN